MKRKVLHGSDDCGGGGQGEHSELMDKKDLTIAGWQDLKRARHEEARKRAQVTIAGKIARGEVTFLVPKGYRNVRKARRTWAEFDPEYAYLILECFKLAETGGYSIDRLRKEMATKGLVGKDGKPLCLASTWLILTNPFYCGYIRRKGELLPGAHPALISKAMFDRVQKHLKRSDAS